MGGEFFVSFYVLMLFWAASFLGDHELAAINKSTQLALRCAGLDSSGYVPRSGRPGSYGI